MSSRGGACLSLSLSLALCVWEMHREDAVLGGYTRGSGGKGKGAHVHVRCVHLRGVSRR